MTNNVAQLTPKQRKMIVSLISGLNVTEAAEACKINRTTFYKWLDQPEFKRTLEEAEAQAITDATLRLASLANDAVDVIKDTMQDTGTLPAEKATRLRAAQITFDNLMKLRELVTLEDRVKKLEEQQNVKSY